MEKENKKILTRAEGKLPEQITGNSTDIMKLQGLIFKLKFDNFFFWKKKIISGYFNKNAPLPTNFYNLNFTAFFQGNFQTVSQRSDFQN